MKEDRIFINDLGCPLAYASDEDVRESGDEELIFLYDGVLYYADILGVTPPYITPAQSILGQNPATGESVIELAHTYFQEDFPDQLDRDFICVNANLPVDILKVTLAHEMRHVWQKQYHPTKFSFVHCGPEESLWAPAEIDADAFAIACFHHYSRYAKVSLQKVARVFCADVLVKDYAAYKKRLNAARHINCQMYLHDLKEKLIRFFNI